MLGYRSGFISSTINKAADSVPIWLDDVNCTGTEFSIEDCLQSVIGAHDCTHNEDVSVKCFNQTVRLAGGTSNQGRLEIYHNNQWGTICDNDFNNRAANVACRMLGLNFGYIVHRSDRVPYAISNEDIPIWMDEVSCTGCEDHLSECKHSGFRLQQCGHGRDVAIACNMSQYEVRLTRGQHQHEGRVEVKVNNIWGSICGNTVDQNTASTICRMFGYSGGKVLTRKNLKGSDDKMPIWLSDLTCDPCASSLWDCSFQESVNDGCTHVHDLAITCHVAQSKGQIRLNGSSLYTGVVEVNLFNEWGHICANVPSFQVADVVCRMIGHSGGQAIQNNLSNSTIQESRTWLINVDCTGCEDSILDCSYNTLTSKRVTACKQEHIMAVLCDLPSETDSQIWAGWGPCSKTCDVGQQMRQRFCQNTDCERPSVQTRNCIQQACGRKVCRQKADIVLLLDRSGSIGAKNWKIMLKFVARVINDFTISDQDVHIALVAFSGTSEVQFTLDKYYNKKDIIKAVENTEYTTGGTRTDLAIIDVISNVFDPSNSGLKGDRTGIPNIALLFTDGQSNEQTLTLKMAKLAKLMGTTMLAVGVTESVDEDELAGVSSSGIPFDTYWTSPHFRISKHIQNSIIRTVCPKAQD